jgi:pilus assembly protein CpaE
MSAPSVPRSLGQWKILVICPDSRVGSELAPLLAEHLPFSQTIEVREYLSRTQLAGALESEGPTLCFVEMSSNRDWAMGMLADLSGLDHRLPVVALIPKDSDSGLILRTLRSGATEFLCSPLAGDQFVVVMERLAAQNKGRTSLGSSKVIAVAPAKGACGASTVASNLVHCYKRVGAKKILLIDLDPLTGTIAFQMKLKQNYSFLEALTRASQMDTDIWNGMVHVQSGVDVMLAPEQPLHGIDETFSPAPIVEFARSLYEVTVIDMFGVYGQWNLTLARLCDELLLVSTNELPALQATQKSLAYLERNRVDTSRVRVVVNRYNKDIGLTEELIQAALRCEILQSIPSDYEGVQKALVEGKPISPATPVGRGLTQLAEKLSGKTATDPVPKPNSLGGIFSFLRR